MLRFSVGLLASAAIIAACGGPPCRGQDDCPFGSYCVLSVGGGGEVSEGECKHDCVSFEDCAQPDPDLATAVCTNEGKCGVQPKPPRVVVLEPETDTVYPEGTRAIRVSGEVETAAAMVHLRVTPVSERGCTGGLETGTTVQNPSPGTYARMAFVIDGIELDPGKARLEISASIEGASRSQMVDIEIACPGCAAIGISEPPRRSSTPGLELSTLSGTIQPSLPIAVWRVRSSENDVIDGIMPVDMGVFLIRRLPLFPGLNRVEVVASGVGGEARCSTLVSSAIAREQGLRALLLWDGGESDLDVHLVGPSGRFGDRASSLSARSQGVFGGTVDDDAFGFGPEVLRIAVPPDGEYGVIVEPIVDGADFGSNATLRVLMGGRSLVPGPIGPRHLTSFDGKMWVAGTVAISGDSATWRDVDELISASAPPLRPPADWPAFR